MAKINNWETYFKSYENYFWEWEEEGDVIAIKGGSTIAYREQITQLLDTLAEQGLPPLGSILLVLAATNNTIADDLKQIRHLLDVQLANTPNRPVSAYADPIEDAFAFLNLLSQVPEKYRSGTQRVVLLQTIFASCHNMLSVEESKSILRDVKIIIKSGGLAVINKLLHKKPFIISVYHRDLRCIALLFRKFPSVNSILEKIKELPQLDIQLDEKETTNTNTRKPDFIDELINTEKTFHVGALVKHIWSGLKIPLHHNMPSERPLGGVSDLTNKGDLDKLLITEYANDDLVFASRLANNEVLYLRREVPPLNDKEERIILVDISLKNWGTPKLMAFAALVAIVKHPKTVMSCKTFAVGGYGYSEITIDTVDSLIETLQIVDAGLHAEFGLQQFIREYSFTDSPEVFYITSPESIKQHAMQKLMQEYKDLFQYYVFVHPTGELELYRNQRNGKKLLQEMKLPLDDLWSKKPPPKPENIENELPYSDYPLLYPKQNNTSIIFPGNTIKKDIYIITSDRKLFLNAGGMGENSNKGLILMYKNVPPCVTQAIYGISADGDAVVFCFDEQHRNVVVLDLFRNEEASIPFQEYKKSSLDNFAVHNGSFIYADNSILWTFTIKTKPNITIEKKETLIENNANLVIETKSRQINAARKYRKGISILRKVEEVYINSIGNLCFNKHSLIINEHSIKLTQYGKTTIKASNIHAQRQDSSNEFVFANNSRIFIDKSGMATLIPAEQKLIYSVRLDNPGANPLAIVKEIKSLTNCGLKEAKELVDGWPNSIISNLDEKKALEIQSTLTKLGAMVSIQEITGTEPVFIPLALDSALGIATNTCFSGNVFYNAATHTEIVKPNIFYQQFIAPFINAIKTHAS